MLRYTAAAVLAATLIAAALDAPTNGAGKDRRYTNTKFGVTVDAPTGWSLSPHTGYPDILVVLVHPGGARISLAASTTALASARDLVEQNRRGLEAQGLTITNTTPAARDGVIIDAQSKTGADHIRQYYVLRTGEDKARQALVLTLTTPSALLSTTQPTFGALVAKLLTDTPK